MGISAIDKVTLEKILQQISKLQEELKGTFKIAE